MRSCMSQICWWISECSSVSISAARRSSSSAAFRLRVSSGNSSALRRRQVLDRLECRGWVVVRVPSALQPSLAGSSEQAQKLNSLPRMPTRPKPSRLKRGLASGSRTRLHALLSRATPSVVSEHSSELIGCPISMSFTSFGETSQKEYA